MSGVFRGIHTLKTNCYRWLRTEPAFFVSVVFSVIAMPPVALCLREKFSTRKPRKDVNYMIANPVY
ncbi:hypothetical protein PPL_06941 [Heterostelium album PN500]|uniref:Uncharacterized protein n=1 Tax=Heterostelium pallidum (strain ATCC 26659 / Pp 5 / PN500) TaxID=670386 RepID=D3BDY8_HETP5|nr:hypothetical protein PPL_06941 [Heterostelium album PN500]EFA80119.1 hypothetical protein PPL_06941 [Heterostelium album PN500]|eukprot:XP_020432239.1 hypothetical protein PPL_06941 [Heterostelium album PN500]